MMTRRQLMQTTAAALAGTALSSPSPAAAPTQVRRIGERWEHYRGSRSDIEILCARLDAKGVPWLGPGNVVRFAVAGDGTLIENLGIGERAGKASGSGSPGREL